MSMTMHGPSTPALGRGMLLFGALMLGLALYLVWTHQWLNAGLWLTVAVFSGCYGAIVSLPHRRWDKLLLLVGLLAGVIAFCLAVWIGGKSW
ncbi:MAG: hypothetical protein NVSMB42_16410 [Herpetosiphon sp.]